MNHFRVEFCYGGAKDLYVVMVLGNWEEVHVHRKYLRIKIKNCTLISVICKKKTRDGKYYHFDQAKNTFNVFIKTL